MLIFVAAAIFLIPIGLISAFLSASWIIESIIKCFWSLSNLCGSGEKFTGVVFGAIALASFFALAALWDRRNRG